MNSLIVKNNRNVDPITTEMIRNDMHKQLATPCLVEKLKLNSIEEVDYSLRKSIVKLLPPQIHVSLAKNFTNFTRIAYQLDRQGILSSPICRMHNVENENNILHLLHCKH